MRVCPRCQESLQGDERVCLECGAPLAPGALADIPAEVHRALAHANLLRLRGDLAGAEAECLSILKRYPNSQPAHTLLGDICDDRGDLEQAERWYDLALELDPQSAGDRRKLEDVRARLHRSEMESTVQQLGIPAKRPFPWFNVAAAGLSIIALSAAAALSVNGSRRNGRPQTIVMSPIEAPASATVGSNPVRAETPAGTGPAVEVPPPSEPTAPSTGAGDETLLRLLVQRSPYGSALIAAQHDPRTRSIALSYTIRPGEDPRVVGAELGRTALETDLEAATVTLRGMRDGTVAYVADVPRAKVAETLTDGWRAANANDPSAFANYVLSNEWTAPESPSGTAPVGP
jgi:RNA polymerase subunit RPABC4/transcription elongation factor Spt4